MVDIGRVRGLFTADTSDFQAGLLAAETRLRLFNQTAQADELAQMRRRLERADASARKLSRTLTAVGVAGGVAVLTYRAIWQQLTALDAANVNLENRLRVISETERDAAAARSELVQISLDLRAPLEDVTAVYSRLGFSLDIADDRVLAITETLIQAGIAGGSSVEELNAGLVQLAQGFASNRFQGDELRSVLENLPGITRILISAMRELSETGQIDFEVRGVGDIRDAAAEGRLTRDVLVQAFELAAGEADELGERIQFSIIQNLGAAKTAALELFDVLEDETGATGGIAEAISTRTRELTNLSQNLREILDAPTGDQFQALVKLYYEGPGFLTEDPLEATQARLDRGDASVDIGVDLDNETINVASRHLGGAVEDAILDALRASRRVQLPSEIVPEGPDLVDQALDQQMERIAEEIAAEQELAVQIEDIRLQTLNRVNQQKLDALDVELEAEQRLATEVEQIRLEALNRVNQQRLDEIQAQADAAAALAQEQEEIRADTLNRINQQRLDEVEAAEQAHLDQQLARARLLGETIDDVFRAAIDDTLEWEDVFLAALSNILQQGFQNQAGGLGFFGGARQFGGPIYRSGDYVVGDRGPETVFLPAGSEVLPAGTGAPTFVFEINGDRRAQENLDMLDQQVIPQLNRIIDGRIDYRTARRRGRN